MSTIETRREQMFPKLEPREIDRLRRFGDVRRYSAGEALFVTGEIAPGMVVLIKGSVRVTRRDPLGHHAPIAEQGAGEFVAEVGQLSGQPAFVDVHAIDDVEALLIPSENLRALVIEEPELGERIMRALILRRVALVEAGAGGPVLIGAESTPDVIRLQGFLARNAYPHQLLDPTQDRDAAELVKQYAPNPADLPLAVCPKGSILKNPSETELARELGMVPIDERERTYDVAVVGAGPAGLSTAVYAASEGLSVIVFDARAFGGQDGEADPPPLSLHRGWSNNRSGRPLPLETSVRGVFAIGDVRSGSVKRVGAAIGEGAVVVARLHAILAIGAAASR
jgi:thioredoxin reductase (NADPH)